MRLFGMSSGGGVQESRISCSRDALADTPSPGSISPLALETAIEAATLVRREPNDDGERIVIICNELGGSFIYSRAEAERRIGLRGPNLAFEDIASLARFLENRVRLHMEPKQQQDQRRTSWMHSWRY